MRIDDISFPSGAHVQPMYTRFVEDGSMRGIFALRRKSGEIIWVRFTVEDCNDRSLRDLDSLRTMGSCQAGAYRCRVWA